MGDEHLNNKLFIGWNEYKINNKILYIKQLIIFI